jgi:hypothetical protein
MAYRIFVFFMVLVMLVNVSFSFEDGRGLVQFGGEASGAITKYYYDKYTCKAEWYLDRSQEFTPDTSIPAYDVYNTDPRGTSDKMVADLWVDNETGNVKYSKSVYMSLADNGPGYDGYFYIISNSRLYDANCFYPGERIARYKQYSYRSERTMSYVTGWQAGYAISVSKQVKNNLVQSNIVAADGTYPDNGAHTDGFWYIKKVISITSPNQNEIVSQLNACIPSITVSNQNGDTLTCKYYIDLAEKESKTISNTATAQVVNFSALDTSTLSDGRHTLKFEVSDGIADPVSQTVDIIVDKSPPTIGSITAASDDSSITVSGSATDTITATPDLQYRYTVGSTVSDWVTATSWKASSLSPNTSYSVKFEAKDSAGHIASSTKTVYTKAQTPQISLSNPKENSIDININDSNPGATQYQLMAGSSYVNAAGAITSSPDWISLTGKKITVTGLSPNMQYVIKAKARNNDGTETDFSTQKTGTTLALSPSGITSEPGINSIKISWNTISNATGYDVEADGKTIDTGTATSYMHSGLQAETTHSYRVRTRNAAGTGQWSGYVNVTTLPNPPDTPVITTTETTYSAITISWDAVAKAASYEIEADGKTIDAGSTTTYTDSGLQPDTFHKYRIRAKNAGGASEWSAYIETGTLPLPPEVPASFKGVPSKNNITLTWSAVDRAEGYELEIDGSSHKLDAVTKYIDEGLSANSTHTYRIRAFNRGGRSVWSSPQTITTWPEVPAAPTNIMATAEKDSITLTWYSSPFAQSYDVQVDGNNTVNIKELSYTQKNLTAGTKHSYRLRAKNITGDGEWSNPIEISTLPEETATTSGGAISLTNIAAVVTNKTITIAWQAAKPNVQYQIEADGQILDNGKDTVYNHTGLKPQSFHTYRVRTVDADGNGQWCAILALSTLPDLPDAPSNVKAVASDTQIELSWTKKDGIAYEVEADGEVLSAGEAVGYINNGLKPGSTHTYRVRGRNITGVTAWSDSITKSTTSPSYEVDCKNGEEFNFSLLAANIDDFGGMTFVVTYNPEQLEVQDLCALTADNEKASGIIPGTNLTVKFSLGRIEFTSDESVAPGTNWSGEISTIVFKSKIDGKAGINYSIE